jgi:hypothetical protein
VWAAARAESLKVRWDGKQLEAAAPELHFLSGRVLDRLRNGAAVTFHIQLSASAGVRLVRRSVERFVISYDLWEERFSAARLSGTRRAVSHLTQAAVEAWCLEQTALSTKDMAPDSSLTLRLEVRAEPPRTHGGEDPESGLSLTALIDAFSRPAREGEQSWSLERGPFRLEEVRQNGNSAPDK